MGFQERGSSPRALEAAACQTTAPTCLQEPLTLLTGLEVHPSRPPASNSGREQVEMNAVDEFHSRAGTSQDSSEESFKL